MHNCFLIQPCHFQIQDRERKAVGLESKFLFLEAWRPVHFCNNKQSGTKMLLKPNCGTSVDQMTSANIQIKYLRDQIYTVAFFGN